MEKIVIGICDDCLTAVEQLRKLAMDYFKKKKQKAEILTFFDGKEVIKNLGCLNILFLDIEMPQMDGIEVGRVLLKKNKKCRIIMATSCEDRYREAFKINAFRFVTKPFLAEEVEEALESAIKTFVGIECVQLYENRRGYDVPQRDISFLKAYDGYIEAIVNGRKMRRDLSLNGIEAILDERLFYRVSRDCIVNLYLIDNYQKGIINIGGDKITVARRKRKEFELAFQRFDLEYRE